MKKILAILMICLTVSPAIAGGVGYVNYEYIFNNYKFAQNAAKEIMSKEKQINDLIKQKEAEYNKLETPIQKQKFEEAFKKEMSLKENEFNALRNKKEEEVYTRIHAVTEKIRLEKNLDAILDSRSVFSGGVDVTNTVLNKLNEHQR